MPRSEEANKQLRDEQRTKILEAAWKVFARKGMAATMDDIAAEASISHGLAYRYFASKEAIFYAILEQAFQSPASGLERFLEMPGTAGMRLESLITEFVESRRRPELYQLLDRMLSDESAPDDLRKLIRGRNQDL